MEPLQGKRELVERSLQPGASVSGIALENCINANVLFKWRREHPEHRRAVSHGVQVALRAPFLGEHDPRSCSYSGSVSPQGCRLVSIGSPVLVSYS
jgi:Transposase